MSVLDLLPHCVSGVYFIYHEDYTKWGLGKLSACREAALAKEGGYRYYYMGVFDLFPLSLVPPLIPFINVLGRILSSKLPKTVV